MFGHRVRKLHSAQISRKATSVFQVTESVQGMAKATPVALGLILLIVGWYLVFAPSVFDSSGDAHSADYYHDLCEDNAWVSFLAPEECDEWNSVWSFGWGVIIVGIVILLLGLIPDRQAQVVVQTAAPQSPRESSSNKYCSSCGVELPLAAKFCTGCGTKIG